MELVELISKKMNFTTKNTVNKEFTNYYFLFQLRKNNKNDGNKG